VSQVNVARRSVEVQEKPHLRVVEGTSNTPRRSAISFLLVCTGLLLIAILVPLVANTNMARISYDMRDVSIQLAEENARIETLEGKVLEVSAPQVIRERAFENGMVPAAPIGVIDVGSGTVEGGVAAQ